MDRQQASLSVHGHLGRVPRDDGDSSIFPSPTNIPATWYRAGSSIPVRLSIFCAWNTTLRPHLGMILPKEPDARWTWLSPLGLPQFGGCFLHGKGLSRAQVLASFPFLLLNMERCSKQFARMRFWETCRLTSHGSRVRSPVGHQNLLRPDPDMIKSSTSFSFCALCNVGRYQMYVHTYGSSSLIIDRCGLWRRISSNIATLAM